MCPRRFNTTSAVLAEKHCSLVYNDYHTDRMVSPPSTNLDSVSAEGTWAPSCAGARHGLNLGPKRQGQQEAI